MRWLRLLVLAALVAVPVVSIIPGTAPRQAAAQAAQAPVPLSDTVYITKTGECYHRGSCRCLSKSCIPIERKEAISRGYRACKLCRP